MIIKANDKLYNCDGWREISRDDEYVTIEFFETYTDEDGSKGFCSHVFYLVDDDYYNALYDKYSQLDYKDVRYIKTQACIKAYKILLAKIADGFDYLDLDQALDQEQLCKEAVADYLKEFEDDSQS